MGLFKTNFVGFILMALAFALYAGSAQAAKTIIDKGLDHPTGHYIVEVMKDGRWVEAGRMKADRFYRTLEADLGAFVTPGSQAKLRITKSGGNLAHMDSVTLGGTAPTSINTGALDKLARKDNDVMDVTKGLELYFDTTKGAKLSLTGRIEGMKIPGMPLMLPKANQHSEKVTMDSAFYSYTVGSVKPGPFFEDYSHAISGHPMSHTMGWVDTKGQRLVVGIDFTGDNTMDGDADFAKVFIKTASGVKEFKVSEGNTKWGTPHFAYTDKVAYQHKVYDFGIPLSEIGAKSGDTIEMAFSTYGTWTNGAYSVTLSHSTVSGGFLGAYRNITNSANIAVIGNMFSPSGAIESPDITLQAPTPARIELGVDTAYDPVNDRYLAVWSDDSTAEHSIFAQIIGTDGTPIGARQTISTLTGTYTPKVAYAQGRFMVVTQRNAEIIGQMLDSSGANSGASFIVNASGSHSYNPGIAGDTVNGSFYVTWGAWDSITSKAYGRLYSSTGAALTDETTLSDITNNSDFPSVGFSPAHQRYLASFTTAQPGVSLILGRLIDKDGALLSTDPVLISNTGNKASYPAVEYDPHNGNFMVAYSNLSITPWEIYGQRVSPLDASPIGTATDVGIPLAADNINLYFPDIAFNSQCLNLMVGAIKQFGLYFGTALDPQPDITLGGTASNIASGSATLTATNYCGATLNISSVTLGGFMPGAFDISNDGCSGAALGVNQSCSVDVTLVGTGGAATLDFASNDPDEPTISAALVAASANSPTAPQPQSPANGAGGVNPASIVFQWLGSTDADGDIVQYDLFVCKDATFATCPDPVNTVYIASADGGMMMASGLGSLRLGSLGLLLTGIAVAGGLGRQRRIAILMLALAIALMALAACGGAGGDIVASSGNGSGTSTLSYTVTGLESGTTYYWKVVAYDGTGNETESSVYSFTTL